jgi:hypothetical protein
MLLQVTKNNGKPHIIRYKRDDGTDTWMKTDDFFVRHDLSHYAIEKTLGYKTAFMGMLNNGMDIRDFDNREKRLQITVTQEACNAENMANLFLIEIIAGNTRNFNEMLASGFSSMQQSFSAPVLSDNEINSIKKYVKELLQQWSELPVGETMTLEF